MVNTRQKGKILEKYIADQIKEKGLDPRAYARGDSGGGNQEKTDITTSLKILDLPAGIEAKNSAKASVKVWWEQTQKLESLGYEPVLVYKLARETLGETKAIIYLETLLNLLQANSGTIISKETENVSKNALFHIEKSKYHMKQAIKDFEA